MPGLYWGCVPRSLTELGGLTLNVGGTTVVGWDLGGNKEKVSIPGSRLPDSGHNMTSDLMLLL